MSANPEANSQLGPPLNNWCHLAIFCPQDPAPYFQVGGLYPFCPLVCTATPAEEPDPYAEGLRFIY